jgi:hypothetical protein
MELVHGFLVTIMSKTDMIGTICGVFWWLVFYLKKSSVIKIICETYRLHALKEIKYL